jgi:hypothetical protein
VGEKGVIYRKERGRRREHTNSQENLVDGMILEESKRR